MLQAIGIFAVAAILGPSRGLHVGRVPRLRPDRAQEGGPMESTCAHFHIHRLHDDAALLSPIVLQFENDLLESEHGRQSSRKYANSTGFAGLEKASGGKAPSLRPLRARKVPAQRNCPSARKVLRRHTPILHAEV